MLVVDKYGKIVGILNFTDLTSFLFGKLKNDGFLHDDDRLAVAKRHIEDVTTLKIKSRRASAERTYRG